MFVLYYLLVLTFESMFLTGETKDDKVEEEIKQNIRASSIPRPRAVLSSPGNFSSLFISIKVFCNQAFLVYTYGLSKF